MLPLAKLAQNHVKVLPDEHASDQGLCFKMLFTRNFMIDNALRVHYVICDTCDDTYILHDT